MIIREIDIKKNELIDESNGIIEERDIIARASSEVKKIRSEVTVIVKAYNGLEKTKRCVESVLKYTADVDYDLFLIDNGSEGDEIYDYFCSVPFEKKTVLRVDKNYGASFPINLISMNDLSEFFVVLANDIIVTNNWARNLLNVMRSDIRIGMVNPISNNTSNKQCVDLEYADYDEMQKMAAEINRTDPRAWEERVRLVTLGTMYRKACIYAIGIPYADPGFFHDFVDDDLSFRIRRMGYKIILARDTWICHDHPVESRIGNNKARASIDSGRENFVQKYYGLDSWEGSNEYYSENILGLVRDTPDENPAILGIDTGCGTEILEIKNKMRSFNKFFSNCYAFTDQSKYSLDLRTICGDNVIFDQQEYMEKYYDRDFFDYIAIGRPINEYHEPLGMLMNAYDLLRPGGRMFFKFKNVFNVVQLVTMLGDINITRDMNVIDYRPDHFMKSLHNIGFKVKLVDIKLFPFSDDDLRNRVTEFVGKWNDDPKEVQELVNRLFAEKYWFMIEK